LQAEKCNENQQWTSTGPSSQHIHESMARQIESQRLNFPCSWRGKGTAGGIVPVLRSLTFTAGHGLMPCPISLADSREGQQLLIALHGREKHLC